VKGKRPKAKGAREKAKGKGRKAQGARFFGMDTISKVERFKVQRSGLKNCPTSY
jgi:hypothetical protein